MAIALVVAAGSGERLGADLPKAFVDLAGRPMLAWSIRALDAADTIEQVIVAAPPGFEARAEVIAAEAAPSLSLAVVAGGASRAESVRNALESADARFVAVHDAARPLVRPDLFDRCVAQVADRGGAAVAATPVTDTIKRVDSDHRITMTLDRSELWAAQTPQAFDAKLLRKALSAVTDLASITDEAQLIERGGAEVRIVEGPADNIKVTTPADLRLAEMLLADAD